MCKDGKDKKEITEKQIDKEGGWGYIGFIRF